MYGPWHFWRTSVAWAASPVSSSSCRLLHVENASTVPSSTPVPVGPWSQGSQGREIVVWGNPQMLAPIMLSWLLQIFILLKLSQGLILPPPPAPFIQQSFMGNLQHADTCPSHRSTICYRVSISLQWCSFLGFVVDAPGQWLMLKIYICSLLKSSNTREIQIVYH